MLAHSPLYAHAPTTTTSTRTGDGNKEWHARPVMGTRHNLDEECRTNTLRSTYRPQLFGIFLNTLDRCASTTSPTTRTFASSSETSLIKKGAGPIVSSTGVC